MDTPASWVFSRGWPALVCIILIAGCSTVGVPRPIDRGPVALVTVSFPPEADFNTLALGKTSAAGTLGGEGALGGAAAGALVPLGMGPIGIVGYPVIAPITTLFGLVVGGSLGAGYGAFHGLSEAQVAQTRALSAQAMAKIDPQVEVARRLAAKLERTRLAVRLMPGAGPARREESRDYASLAGEFHAILELAMERIGMAAHKGDPPRVALEMRLRIKLLYPQGEDGQGTKTLDWAGRPRTLSEWRAGGPALLSQDFTRGYDDLAQYSLEMLFAPSVMARDTGLAQ